MKPIRSASVLSLLFLLFFRTALSPAQTAPPAAGEMIGREIDLLQFFGGGSALSPAEKQEAAPGILATVSGAHPSAHLATQIFVRKRWEIDMRDYRDEVHLQQS
jgi:hypothetical protein